MRQSTADPTKSAWEYLHVRPFNSDATPLGPLGILVIMHNKRSRHKSWDYREHNGFSAGIALNHYCCKRAIDANMKAVSITDTVKFSHQYLTKTGLTPTDCLIHALHSLISAMNHAPEVKIL